MASSMHMLKRVCSAVKGCNIYLNTARNIHVSCAAGRKKSEISKTDQPSSNKSNSEKDELLGAAADVAASMKGLEEEAFSDLTNQLFKMESLVDERTNAKSIITPLNKMAKVLSETKVKPVLDEHAKSRISAIKEIYHRSAADSKEVSNPRQAKSAAKDNMDKPVQEPVMGGRAKSRKSIIKELSGQHKADGSATSASLDQLIANIAQPLKPKVEGVPDTDVTEETGSASEQTEALESDEISGPELHEIPQGQRMASQFDSRQPNNLDDSRKPLWVDWRQERVDKAEGRQDRQRRPRFNGVIPLATRMLRSADIPDGQLHGGDLLDKVEPLNIFNPSKWTDDNKAETIPMVQSWVDEREQSIKEAQVFPFNGFEEMIRWTEEGKLWHFPINNEQGMDEELNTPFYEHVFLDKHLKAFPQTGSVRRFMELVITGLSKNPHLAVKEKVAHIQWFENYFKQKQPYVTTQQLLADVQIADNA